MIVIPNHLAFLILSLMVTGCGRGSTGCVVRGTVTLDGEPLAAGAIQLLSNSNPVAGAEIKDGKFQIRADAGVKPGTYRVEVTSMKETGKEIRMSSGAKAPEFKNVIPDRYNKKSELTASINVGTTDLPFELASK